MKTTPDMTFEEHIERLLTQLKKFFPNLKIHDLLFYDAMHGALQEKAVRRNDLIDFYKFKKSFTDLCKEGHEWINIAGDSWYGKYFLIQVEYSKSTNYPLIAVNISGPSLGVDGTPLLKTKINIT